MAWAVEQGDAEAQSQAAAGIGCMLHEVAVAEGLVAEKVADMVGQE